MINQIAKSWKNNPPNEIIPAILKSFPPTACVFFQTALLPQCPRRSDSYEPVLFRVFEEESDIDEQYSEKEGKSTIRTDLVPDAPKDNLDLYSQKIENEQENESLIIVPELLVILFEGVDEGNTCKQGNARDHNKGDETNSPELRHVSVSLAGSIPV